MKISVVGLGKLGAPILAVLAAKGHTVVGIDTNPTLVDQINRHTAPVEEPGLQDLLTAHAARISATSDWSKAIRETDLTCVIVPTPSGPDGAFRNDHLLAAVSEIGGALTKKKGYHLVAVNSTTMPGSVGGPIRERLERASGRRVGINLGLCYKPEFIALGDVIHGLLHPDFVLIGQSDEKAGGMLEDLYRDVCGNDANIARMNLVNAELTKIAVNTYVTMKISFANMLGEICDQLHDADAAVVADAIGRDTRIGAKYLKPAVGYGGPCFPRDTVAFAHMARQIGAGADLALSAETINRRQVTRLRDIAKNLVPTGSTIAILGLAYKPDTPVIEESQGIMLASALVHSGFKVIAHDPMALSAARSKLGKPVQFATSAYEALAQADVAFIMTPWAEYAAIRPEQLASRRLKCLIDCWRQLKPALFEGVCKIAHLGEHGTLVAAARREAAE